MINDNQDIFTTEDCKVGKTTWETFKIELLPNARPVNQRMRLILLNLKDNLHAQLDLWLKNEVIEPSSSPWSSPLVPVTKKTGETRWVLDFRRVNDLSVTDSFPTEGVKLIPFYVQKITEWPLPQTGKELSAFLGFTNYYRDFYQVLRT